MNDEMKSIVNDIHASLGKNSRKDNSVDPVLACKLFGINVFVSELKDDYFGTLIIDNVPLPVPALHVNKIDDGIRNRFHVAHLLGHYLYHRDHGGGATQITCHRLSSMTDRVNEVETYANDFASLLLLPTNEFLHSLHNKSLVKTANEFNVPIELIQYFMIRSAPPAHE